MVDLPEYYQIPTESTPELVRVEQTSDAVAEFDSGEFIAETGKYGSGTYVKTRSRVPPPDPGSHTLELKFRQGARVSTYRHIVEEQRVALDEIDGWIAEQQSRPYLTRDHKEIIENLHKHRLVLEDVGRFAAHQGYDGYQVDVDYSPFWVITNRTAMVRFRIS